jgi:opacity protein-like surface antigen
MFKKILVTAVIASAMNVAVASPVPYVGASLGIVNNSTTSGVVNGSAGVFRGMPFSVLAGYGGVLSQGFYLAGELAGTVGTGEISNSNGLKTTYGYAASVVPGVMLSEHTLGFARAGVVRSRFSNVSSMATGGQFGVGMQAGLTQNVDLRGEYDFTAYRSVGNVGAPRSDAFNLGLIYKFD